MHRFNILTMILSWVKLTNSHKTDERYLYLMILQWQNLSFINLYKILYFF